IPRLKCPFCNFRNIDEDTILHHIRWTDNSAHWVDIDKIDRKSFFIPKTKKKDGRYHYEIMDELPLPWIRCLWCSYRHKKEHNLGWHFYEEHRYEIYKIGLTNAERRQIQRKDKFWFLYSPIEFQLEKAVRMAKSRTRVF